MEALNYFLTILILSLGIPAGVLLAVIAKEELQKGEKYFRLLQKILLLAAIILTAYASRTAAMLIVFGLLISSGCFMLHKKYPELPVSILLGIVFFASAETNLFLPVAAIIMLCGLPTGTLMFMRKKSVKYFILMIAVFIATAGLLFGAALISAPHYSDTTYAINDSSQYLEGSTNTAVILVHGFGASPWEVQELALFLNSKNLTVYSILLPGHTTYDAFESTSWQEWYSSLENAYIDISKKYSNVFVGGVSLGGLLSLCLAEHHSVNGVLSIDSIIYPADKRAYLAGILKIFAPYVNVNLTDEELSHYQHKRPLSAVYELVKNIRACKPLLNEINSSVLILQANQDNTINPKSAEFIYNNLVSEKRLIYYNETNHVLVRSESKETVFNDIYTFITNVLAEKGSTP